MFGVFRVKNHDFTPKNHIFSNFGGGPPGGSPPGSTPDIYSIMGRISIVNQFSEEKKYINSSNHQMFF
jgi:hypothetical protein